MITVLITTHNYGRFVEQAIDSVLSQDFPLDQVEILVVDDGSTDDTPERVKKYGSRIEYLYKPNGGQASALNLGIAKARGEIIALLDADDLFQPSKLTHVMEAFRQNPALGMVYHGLEEWHTQTDQRIKRNFPLISGDIRKEPDKFFFYYPHPTSCISFQRTALNPLLPIPEAIRMIADAYLVNLLPFLSPILAIPESLILYRIHGKNSLPYFANAYHADDSRMPIETREIRLRLWKIVIDAMSKWLSDHGFTREHAAVRSALDRWTLHLQSQEFLVKPPGRLRLFAHLLLYNRRYGPYLSRRLRVINRVNALGALVVGYKHFRLLEKWRLAAVGAVKRAFGSREAKRGADAVKI